MENKLLPWSISRTRTTHLAKRLDLGSDRQISKREVHQYCTSISRRPCSQRWSRLPIFLGSRYQPGTRHHLWNLGSLRGQCSLVWAVTTQMRWCYCVKSWTLLVQDFLSSALVPLYCDKGHTEGNWLLDILMPANATGQKASTEARPEGTNVCLFPILTDPESIYQTGLLRIEWETHF